VKEDTITQTSLKQLNVVDWSRQKKAILSGEIQPDTRIGDITGMAIHALNLPKNVPYSAFVTSGNGEKQRKLNKTDTVSDIALNDDAELMVAPEVSAG
jgi:hypothetical protein